MGAVVSRSYGSAGTWQSVDQAACSFRGRPYIGRIDCGLFTCRPSSWLPLWERHPTVPISPALRSRNGRTLPLSNRGNPSNPSLVPAPDKPAFIGHPGGVVPTCEIDTHPLAEGVNLHLHPTSQYKSTRVDIFLTAELRSPLATERALIARLLERGTSSLPGVRLLNCFLDGLYGAGFGVGVDQYGSSQVLHVTFEVIDPAYLPEQDDLLGQGLRFLRDVLSDPNVEGDPCGFPEAVVAREKEALRKEIESVFSDKTAYAHRRCVEIMCAGEPRGIAPHGRFEDLPQLQAVSLLSVHRNGLERHGIDIYVSGREPSERVLRLCEELFSWRGEHALPLTRVPGRAVSEVREVIEEEAIQQGKLVCGYRTGVTVGDPEYPAMLLLDHLLGGDLHSRLQRSLREERGLCYHVSSFIEPLCGLLFVEASVDAQDYVEARRQIDFQLDSLRSRGPLKEELEAARAAVLQRLSTMAGDRETLVGFHFQRRIADVSAFPARLCEQLRSVTSEEVANTARHTSLDTIFFLGNRKAPPSS